MIRQSAAARLLRPRVLLSSTLVKNTGWMTVANGWRLGVQAAYFILIARMLGVSEFGRFAAALALVSILSPFAALGSGNLMVMHVAKRPATFPDRWGIALIAIPLFGVPLALFTVGVGRLVVPAVPLELIAAVCLSEFLVSRLCDSAAQAFQATDRMALTAGLSALPGFARLIAAILAISAGTVATAVQWGWWYLAATCAAAAACYVAVHLLIGGPRFANRLSGPDLREGSYFAIAQAAVSIYTDIDKALLARFGTLAGAGVYAAAYRATSLAFVPVLSMLYATYARFFKAGEAGIRGSQAFARRLLPFTLIYSVVAGALLLAAAPLLPLVLGSDFSNAAGAVRWLSALPLIQATSYLAGDVLTGARRQGIRSVIQLGAALLNVGLCYLLIPTYGWRGAAWATLLSLAALSAALWIAVAVLHSRERAMHRTRLRVLAWPAFDARNKNPYNRLLYESVCAADSRIDVVDWVASFRVVGGAEVWHVHWPETAARSRHAVGAFCRALGFVALVTHARVRGTKIVWTVHNLRGHDSPFPRLERFVLRWLSKRVDGFIVLSDRGRFLAVEAYPALAGRPFQVVAHGHLIGVYRDAISTESARTRLGFAPDDHVVAFVGRVNGYKNVPRLVEQFRESRLGGARLIVAGEPASSVLERQIRDVAGGDDRIRLELRHIADDEIQVFLRAADVVALPFADVLNSSTAILALSFGCPVLVPASGAMVDLAAELGRHWVRLYDGELRASDIERALRAGAASAADAALLDERLRGAHDWASAGRLTAGFYHRVVSPA